MSVAEQAQRLVDLGVPSLADIAAEELRALAMGLPEAPGAVLSVHPSLVPASRLATLLTHDDRSGFVVSDMTDLDQFTPIDGVQVPDAPLYLLNDVRRGDEMRNRSPDEALRAITALPAIWISGGTGRDGRANKNAPKVGWCWAGNRHAWLGFASTRRRTAGGSSSS